MIKNVNCVDITDLPKDVLDRNEEKQKNLEYFKKSKNLCYLV